MLLRMLSGCVVAALLACVAVPSAFAAGAHHRQTNIDTRKKRITDTERMRRRFIKQGSRKYFVHKRRDGRVTYRKLWRNTKRRLGNAKATPDAPAFLQQLEAWRAKRAAGVRR